MVRAEGRNLNVQYAVPNLRHPNPPKPPIRPVRMTTRAEWEAAPPQGDIGERIVLPISHIRYRYTGTEYCVTPDECTAIVKRLQRESQDEGNPDIMYNFLIGGDNVMYEGRGWDYHGLKKDFWVDTEGESISIAYIGNFKGELVPPDMRHVGEHFIKWGSYHRLFDEKLEVTPSIVEPYDKEEMDARLQDVPEFTHISLEKLDELYKLPVGSYLKEFGGDSPEGKGSVGDEGDDGDSGGEDDEDGSADGDSSIGDGEDFNVDDDLNNDDVE